MRNADIPAMPPNAGWRDNEPRANGLTKREHIAAMMMQGLTSNEDTFSVHQPDELAELAVENADALLAELEKRHEP